MMSTGGHEEVGRVRGPVAARENVGCDKVYVKLPRAIMLSRIAIRGNELPSRRTRRAACSTDDNAVALE